MSSNKLIVLDTPYHTIRFHWYGAKSGDLHNESGRKVGTARVLEDAIAIARANSNEKVNFVKVDSF